MDVATKIYQSWSCVQVKKILTAKLIFISKCVSSHHKLLGVNVNFFASIQNGWTKFSEYFLLNLMKDNFGNKSDGQNNIYNQRMTGHIICFAL